MDHVGALQQIFNAVPLRQRDSAEVITLPDVDTKEEGSVAFVRERKLLANCSDDLIPHRVARDSREQIIYPNTHQNEAFGVDTIENTGVGRQLRETIGEPKLAKILVEQPTALLYRIPGMPLIRRRQPSGSASLPGRKSAGKSSIPCKPCFAHCSKPAGVVT